MTETIGTADDVAYMATFVFFASAFLLEAVIPFRASAQDLGWRWFNNFSLSLVTWYLSHFLGTLSLVWLAGFSSAAYPAVLGETSLWISATTLLIATQFIGYWIHRAFHSISCLWPIHAVHHTDTDVDASTTFRHHPLEPLLSLPIVAPLVLLLGPPAAAVLVVRVIDTAVQIYSHTNVQLPDKWEKIVNKLLVTPGFHRVHHSDNPTYTNSNYGSVLPWFDYLFGTARRLSKEAQLQGDLGLEYERDMADSRLDRLLSSPFRRWMRGSSNSHAAPETLNF